MKITFGGHYIELELDGKGSGNLTSNLKDVGDSKNENMDYYTTIDGLEALVLAQACVGIDVQSTQYIKALEVAMEAIANNT